MDASILTPSFVVLRQILFTVADGTLANMIKVRQSALFFPELHRVGACCGFVVGDTYVWIWAR